VARIRSIKPGFFSHKGLNELERDNPGQFVMLTFAAIWGHADGAGVLEINLERLVLQILPYIDYDRSKTLDLLAHSGNLVRYRYHGREYAAIVNFKKHQRITGKEATDKGFRFPLPANVQEIIKALENVEQYGAADDDCEIVTVSPLFPQCFTSRSPLFQEKEKEKEKDKEKEGKNLLLGESAERGFADAHPKKEILVSEPHWWETAPEGDSAAQVARLVAKTTTKDGHALYALPETVEHISRKMCESLVQRFADVMPAPARGEDDETSPFAIFWHKFHAWHAKKTRRQIGNVDGPRTVLQWFLKEENDMRRLKTTRERNDTTNPQKSKMQRMFDASKTTP